jgi:hypothetical protein
LLIGKPSFTERDYEHTAAVWPYSVKLGPGGELAIADTQYCRVLWWLHWQAALAGEPPRLIGQPDLASNGPNQLALRPGPAGLNWCYDTAFWRGRLWVADTANSRVLAFALGNDPLPQATALLGQKDYHTGSENPDTVRTTEGSLYWPFALCPAGEALVVADTGNHRLLIYEPASY